MRPLHNRVRLCLSSAGVSDSFRDRRRSIDPLEHTGDPLNARKTGLHLGLSDVKTLRCFFRDPKVAT